MLAGGWKAGGEDNGSSPGFQFRFASLQKERTGIAIASSFLWYFQNQPAAAPQWPMQQACFWKSSPTNPPSSLPNQACVLSPAILSSESHFYYRPALVSLCFLAPTWLCPLLRDLSKNQLHEGAFSYPNNLTELLGSRNTISSFLLS